jgi:hypothetical protein
MLFGVALFLTPGLIAGTPASPQHDHHQAQPAPSNDMSAKCQAMMAEHQKTIAEMKAAEARLDGLVAKMTAATGQAKVDATAAVVEDLAAYRKASQQMMKMQENMMAHMMEHMQAGGASMGMCPMMKMGDMKH